MVLGPMGLRLYVIEAEGRERSQPHMAQFSFPHESTAARSDLATSKEFQAPAEQNFCNVASEQPSPALNFPDSRQQ